MYRRKYGTNAISAHVESLQNQSDVGTVTRTAQFEVPAHLSTSIILMKLTAGTLPALTAALTVTVKLK